MLEELNRDDLYELLYYYNQYIQHASDTDAYKDGWYPVCIEEFYSNDLEVWKELEHGEEDE